MKILLLHSDFVEFEPKQKAMKSAEEIEMKKEKIEDCLVVFTAVEKGDEKHPESSAKKLAKEVKDVACQIKATKVVIYPYAHLSRDLASPDSALKILRLCEEALRGDFSVSRAPFGWYKEFTIKCKGHPLAELSRDISAEEAETKKDAEVVSESLEQEEKVKSSWFILAPDGKISEITIDNGKIKGFDFSNHENLKKFASYELAKVRVAEKEPPHIRLMRKLEIADYEPGSDPGNLRFYPKGRLIKSLIETWVTQKVIEYGAMEIESPIMYDYEHPALKDYLNRFPARQYVVESAKKRLFLRFAACFGQFLMKADANISYKNLPLKMYELTRYSFRLEKAGELTGLRRLRAFTMPDMHTLCRDIGQAREEFKQQFRLSIECMADLGFNPDEFETAIRFTEEFWNDNKDFVISLAKMLEKPVLIERWNFRYAYFDPKFEFNIVDALDKCSALSTVQIDHENAKRYNIQYTDSDNARKYPTILHCSPSGGIERVIYALLEKAWMKGEKRAVLPLWLSPIQVRICPMNDVMLEYCQEISKNLEEKDIRVDIDDRSMTIQKKISESESEWVPMTIVIGEKEKASGKLAVRFRETGKIENMEASELVKLIKKNTEGFPFKPLSLPKLLTKRPIFVG